MTGTIGGMPKPKKRPVRSFRVEDEIWLEAMQVATERQESLSDVVLRPALVRYVRTHRRQAATTTEVSGE